jgi:hypothetical protein
LKLYFSVKKIFVKRSLVFIIYLVTKNLLSLKSNIWSYRNKVNHLMKVKPRIYTLSLFILFFSLTNLNAQMKRFRIVPKYIEFNPKIEVKLLGGISQPIASYAKLTDVSSDEYSSATQGYFGELRLIQRSPLKPLWSLQLSLGYMQHALAEEELMQEFQLASFQGDQWRHYYIMPGIAFRGGVRFRFELNASGGILVYNGFNASRAVFGKNQVLDVLSWEYPYAMGAAIRTGLNLGFKINKRWAIFAEANYWLGRGRREGIRRTETYNLDPLQLVAIDPPIFSLDQTVFDTMILNVVNFGIGLRYKAYKHFYNPNIKYWNYY